MQSETQPVLAVPHVRGTTDVLFAIADPVAQMKAPEVFNHVFASFGIDAVVVPARVRGHRLRSWVREAFEVDNVKGLFVSIPHKTPMVDVLDRSDDESRAAGACNAVRRGAEGTIEGALFDGAGLLGALGYHGVPLEGRRVLLLGAGGAGLAIAAALSRCPIAELAVYDQDPARAEMLARRVGALSPHPVKAAPSNEARGYGVVINATPLGLKASDPMPLDPVTLDRGATVVDILMTARPTPLESACAARAITAHPGHEMLIQQVPAYLSYFGYADAARALGQRGHPVMAAIRAAMSRRPAPSA